MYNDGIIILNVFAMNKIIGVLLVGILAIAAWYATTNTDEVDMEVSESVTQQDESEQEVEEDESVSEVVSLAEAFLATLDAEQVAQLQLDYSVDAAQNWSCLLYTSDAADD